MKLLTILKLADKKFYYAKYYLHGEVHKISLKIKKDRPRSEAYEKWYKLLKDYKEEVIEKDSLFIKDKNISECIEEFREYRLNNTQKSTFRSDKYGIKLFSDFLVEKNIIKINQINDDCFKQFINYLDKNNKSGKTINNYISLINSFFNYCFEKDYIPVNFLNTKKYWRKKKKEPLQIINKDEAKLIIDYIRNNIKDEKYRMFMLLPFYTGLRFSEGRGLRKRNIDFINNKNIFVNEKWACSIKDPELLLKSRAARRFIPIHSLIYQDFFNFVQQCKDEYIFSHIWHGTIMNIVKTISKEFKVKFNYHQARHYYASALIANGVDLKRVQYLLGHEDFNITYNTYGHLIQEMDNGKYDKIDF